MKILLITSSARGHAIADALIRSPQQPELSCISPQINPGIKALGGDCHAADIMDIPTVLSIAERIKPDFAFIGPDDPIGFGLADALEDAGIPTVAPKKTLARIEASKGFTRDLLRKYQIDASPKFQVFTQHDDAAMHAFIEDCDGEYVVKYDALKGGKGVKLSGEHLDDADAGVNYAKECIDECGRVVLEEKLIGVEFSLLAFVSGETVVDMPAVQDHKRAFVGDTGPNTGGMGTYSDANHSLPFLTEADMEAAAMINKQTAAALKKETGEDYKGILYGGFIATKHGVKLIEYNARFGDPEALNILPLLESDFVAICMSILDGSLDHNQVQFANKATVCKYIVPKSYPNAKDQRDMEVSFPAIPENARLFFGDMHQDEDGTYRLGGSRSAGIVGIADTIHEAEAIAQQLCEQVQGPIRFRHDIGTDAVVQERIDTMQVLRS